MGSTTSQLAVPTTSIAYIAGVIGLSIGSLARVLKIWLQRWSFGQQIETPTDQRQEQVRAEVDKVRQVLDRKTDELASLIQENDTLKGEVKTKDSRVGVLEEELSKARRQLEELGEVLDQSKGQSRILEEELQNRAKELETTATELERERAKHDDTRALLEPSSLGSKPQPDSASTAEIISMLEELNTEMLHTAAHIADAFEFDDVQSWTEEYSPETQDVCSRVKNVIGNRMMQLLRSTPHNEDPTIIQIALQACLAVYTEWIIGTWHQGESSPDIESLLVNLFETVREGGETPR
jgi:predicted  nucleic acid-binding Zn-ribbon protein